jgi:quercetin dioxygenase-like cupin family protein
MSDIIRAQEIEGVEIHTVDHVFLKQFIVPRPSIWPQHAHAYEHLTMLVRGEIKIWRSDLSSELGSYKAPSGITIPAGVRHTIVTIVPDTEYWCVHNVMRKEIVELLDEDLADVLR